MDTLLEDATVNKFVYTNTNSRLRYVKDNTSTSMVMLVRHTLVDGGVCKDIYVITDLDGEEVLGEVGHAMFPKFLGEHVARTRTDAK